MTTTLGKWIETIKIGWSTHTAYRLNFFLQIIGPALVFFFVKYNLWSSIYGGDPNTVIGGYDFNSMINYHVWTLIVGLLAQGHMGVNMAMDIRYGRISAYLIYPINFWEYHSASFIAFELLQLMISLLTIGIIYSLGLVALPSFFQFMGAIGFCFVVSCFWFSIQYISGMLAFWLEETWMIRIMFGIISAFLSGAILPLELYPEWLVQSLEYSPFPYMTYYPVKIFMGENVNILKGLLIVVAWTSLTGFIASRLWKKGLKMYTAAGM